MRGFPGTATTIAGVLVAGGHCLAATIRVPEDMPSVLAAVDVAVPGDSVLVGPGTWTEADTRTVVAPNGTFVITACAFPKGGVVIRGEGPEATVLDGSVGSTNQVVFLAARSGEGVLRVESLTLTGGGRALTGLYSDGVEARYCLFEGNVNPGGAILGVLECPLTLRDSEFRGNASSYTVRLFDAPLEVARCRFEQNTGRCVQTDTEFRSDPIAIRDSEFVGNRYTGSGVGLNLQNNTNFIVERCLFLGNVTENGLGAGIRSSGSSGVIRHCVFAYDSTLAVSGVAGGVVIEGGTVQVGHNTFVGCYAGLNGAAFVAAFGASGAFHNNVVAYSPRPAVRFVSGTSFTSGCNLFWGNTAGDFGGGGAPAPTDFIADPLFCDLPGLDFTVRDDSPCLSPPTPSCAPIGALGAGCGGVAIEATSFGRIKSLFR